MLDGLMVKPCDTIYKFSTALAACTRAAIEKFSEVYIYVYIYTYIQFTYMNISIYTNYKCSTALEAPHEQHLQHSHRYKLSKVSSIVI